jgi:hypothetical protein
MERDWIKIYTSSNLHKASIVEAVLKDHEIDVVQLNKQDSSYLNFGEIELYIHPSSFDRAIELIIKNEL